MQIGSTEWITLLIRGAAEMDVTVTMPQARQMADHAQALMDWNRKVNLTAISDPFEVAIKHCLDAILPSAHIPSAGALLDMGTGGGFPGIPLKIMRPEQSMTLIDGSRKKINFVKFMIRQLQLPHIEAIQVRAEDLGRQPACQGRFDAIICRAMADLGAVLRMAAPLLATNGKVLVYQGPSDAPRLGGETEESKKGKWGSIRTVSYQLPFLGDHRTLVIVPALDLG